MKPTNYGTEVRVRTERANGQDYEVVETLNHGKWTERQRYGHMNDDHALTHARQFAQALATARIGGH